MDDRLGIKLDLFSNFVTRASKLVAVGLSSSFPRFLFFSLLILFFLLLVTILDDKVIQTICCKVVSIN